MSTEIMTMPGPGARRGPRVRAAVGVALVAHGSAPTGCAPARSSAGAAPAPHATALAYESVVATSRRCAGWYGWLCRALGRRRAALPALRHLARRHAGVRAAPPFTRTPGCRPRALLRRAAAAEVPALITVTAARTGGRRSRGTDAR
ncbi:transglutaminase-like protein [Streptomyces sp. KL116D]|uniref:transglutaminase-like protein n=1 Tax=Streptomyces sp. KL116D TaxID=3045152 RepID=UPI003556444E